ncbi:hypothetical protein ACVXG7_12685 [Enterobacter hormaechei]
MRDYVSNDVYINNLQANYVDALGTASMPRFMAATSKPCRRRGSGALSHRCRWTGRWAWMGIVKDATGTT